MEFTTRSSVEQCAMIFRDAVKASYGGGRRLLRGVSVLRGSESGGLEFFEPHDTPFSRVGVQPTWCAGAYVPGYSKMHGATRVAVHIYVLDEGESRTVQLVGPYSVGEKGSTERLMKSIADRF